MAPFRPCPRGSWGRALQGHEPAAPPRQVPGPRPSRRPYRCANQKRLTAAAMGRMALMPRKWWTLAVVCVATFMLLLDITIVNVALPKIASDLKANFSDIQWVIDAHALTLAALLRTAGALAHLPRRRR